MLVQLAREKFGSDAAEELTSVLREAAHQARLSAVARELLSTATADEFVARIRRVLAE